MDSDLIKAQDIFVEKVNQVCGKFGLNNVMAQLYAILYINARPMSLNEMVERLNVSKGSVSVNIRALERYGAVRRMWVKGSRKDYYEAESDISKVIIERVKSMASRTLSEIEEMLDAASPSLNSIAGCSASEKESIGIFKARIEKLRAFYNDAKTMLELFKTAFANSVLAGRAEDMGKS